VIEAPEEPPDNVPHVTLVADNQLIFKPTAFTWGDRKCLELVITLLTVYRAGNDYDGTPPVAVVWQNP
jgi:hypothetical protein